MIIGIVADASRAETLLNNLSEADFDLKQVSVVMQNPAQRKAIADDVGPLRGAKAKNLAARLAKAGLSDEEAKALADAVAKGKVLVALNVPSGSEAAAREMLQDASAEMIKG